MKNLQRKKWFWGLILSAFLVFGFSGFAGAADTGSLPRTMLWSCYDVGSSGYVQASAIADALVKKHGVRVRLLPSGTSIGRLMPLTTRRVDAGFLATEVFFATEATYDFSTIEWGPQDLRVALAPPTAIASFATTKVSGVKALGDLKGKRISWIPGAPTLNVKADALLAFAGLTWDDVERVEFSSYGASLKALIEGKTDASLTVTSASIMYELESSPKGLYWIPIPPDDKEGWKKLLKACPFFRPIKATVGAGVSEENPVDMVVYPYPLLTVYADKSVDWVYNLVKAVDETFPMYEKAHVVMPNWSIGISGVPPADAPFHEGAVKYLKEKGVWKEEHDKWNQERLDHMKKVQALWEEVLEELEEKKMKSKALPEYWKKRRAEAFGG
jgi:TRAP transporter TAXI family solute receptor